MERKIGRARFDPAPRIGVNAVEEIFLSKLKWIFREQPIVDMGIDAHVESVENGTPTGKLLALQIKSGDSHLRDAGDSYTYYGDVTHLEYWLGHALPVILVVHLPSSSETLWTAVNEGTVERTKKAWKVSISKNQTLSENSREELRAILDGTPREVRLRKLSIDMPLMKHIQSGGKVSVALEHWINKSLGRTPVEVFICDADGEETLSREWFQIYTGFGAKELAETLFPWAEARVDDEFYDLHADLDRPPREWRDDDGEIVVEEPEDSVYPYMEAFGEVEYYRLRLDLNAVGKAYLLLSDYADGSD